ncbi:hypothetical protein CANINC_003218 [Pichia inconspicua]|uniref:Uncharacterized protein n=1 Tax=Pichia inconspicua TaxID=52247 RepID=A0A4T0WZB3_9ASCO|nr:hypothetical protein CANINC_003218 [[Candida] inconspicua]
MSIEALIAQYLRAHGYVGTAAKFEEELGVKLKDPEGHEPLESIIKDRLQFDTINDTEFDEIHHAKADLKAEIPNWHPRRPDFKKTLQLGVASLIIYCTSWRWKNRTLGLFVTNTKQLIVYDLINDELLLTESFTTIIKLVVPVNDTIIAFADMSGSIQLKKLVQIHERDDDETSNCDWKFEDIQSEPIKLHRRLIIDMKYSDTYFASIGWDNRVVVGSIIDSNITIIDEATLQTNPTLILLMKDISGALILLVGRLDSSLLHMFTLKNNKLEEIARLSLNDSEFSTYSFHPMALSQIKSNLVTVATDHIPFMRLITINIPKLTEIKTDPNSTIIPIIRALIVSNYNSMSPQDKYSSPIILTRPKGAGLWIAGDDGKLRGIDLKTGVIMEELESNEGRAKSAFITTHSEDEIIVIAGAVDRSISIWKFS